MGTRMGMGMGKGKGGTLESNARGAEEVAVGVDGDLGGWECHVEDRKRDMRLVVS